MKPWKRLPGNRQNFYLQCTRRFSQGALLELVDEVRYTKYDLQKPNPRKFKFFLRTLKDSLYGTLQKTINRPLEDLPLMIHHQDPYIRAIVLWRLRVER